MLPKRKEASGFPDNTICIVKQRSITNTVRAAKETATHRVSEWDPVTSHDPQDDGGPRLNLQSLFADVNGSEILTIMTMNVNSISI